MRYETHTSKIKCSGSDMKQIPPKCNVPGWDIEQISPKCNVPDQI
jgi:hypothetical protein